MSKRDAVDRERTERQLAACRRMLDAVGAYGADWRGRGGRPIADLTDVVLHTFLARSTRTFEAIVHLGSRGFGEQAAMLNRSLFEDMVDAHWVSLHRELALQRVREHHRYSNQLKLDVAARFPQFFGEELPALDPPMTDEERKALKRVFGTYGQKSWTGLDLHTRFTAIESCWTNEVSRRQARFFHLWVHRENNETLHPTAYSLANLGSPEAVGEEELHFMTGSTEHLVGQVLFCAFWTYAQTACLVLEGAGFNDLETLARDVIEPGLAAIVMETKPEQRQPGAA